MARRLSEWRLWKYAATATLLFYCLGCQTLADHRDQKALIRQCQVPDYALLKEYIGFPSMSGFGQREGLTLSAKYSIPESRVKEFENMLQAQDAEWEPLPIPPEILKRIRFKFQSLNLQSTTGFFRCRTAGSNVLYEQDTSPCSNPKSWVMIEKDPPRWERQEVPLQSIDSFSDIILSMYEPNTRTFSASVKSGY